MVCPYNKTSYPASRRAPTRSSSYLGGESGVSSIIDKPVEAVWSYLGDPAKWPMWAEDIAEVRTDAADKLGVGSVMEYEWRGNRMKADITHYESERIIAIHIPEKRYELFESFALRPADSGTEVTMRMEFQPTGFWMNALAVILSPLKGLLLGRSIKGTLAQLDRAASS